MLIRHRDGSRRQAAGRVGRSRDVGDRCGAPSRTSPAGLTTSAAPPTIKGKGKERLVSRPVRTPAGRERHGTLPSRTNLRLPSALAGAVVHDEHEQAGRGEEGKMPAAVAPTARSRHDREGRQDEHPRHEPGPPVVGARGTPPGRSGDLAASPSTAASSASCAQPDPPSGRPFWSGPRPRAAAEPHCGHDQEVGDDRAG